MRPDLKLSTKFSHLKIFIGCRLSYNSIGIICGFECVESHILLFMNWGGTMNSSKYRVKNTYMIRTYNNIIKKYIFISNLKLSKAGLVENDLSWNQHNKQDFAQIKLVSFRSSTGI